MIIAIIGSNLDVNPKVRFYETVKEYEQKLNRRAARDDIALHSYIISQTSFPELRRQTGITASGDFNRRHIYFRAQVNYVHLLIGDVLTNREQVPDSDTAEWTTVPAKGHFSTVFHTR